MSYRDDIYKPENLIGYTGHIDKNPSVYFQKGTSYGHITQFHYVPFNVGREEVGDSATYAIGNEDVDGKQVSVERADGEVIHTSRTAFTPKSGLTANQLALLYQAITKFPELKEMATMPDQKYQQVFNKLNMLDELASK